MKKAFLFFCMLIGTAHAKPIVGQNDYGELLSPEKFGSHCRIEDPGLSGSPIIDAYSNAQVSCDTIQSLYSNTYARARVFFSSYKYDFAKPAPIKTLVLRIVTLADLNNPDNFSETDSLCMKDLECESGAYFGRTFFSSDSSNINIYVVYSSAKGKYSFVSTLKHELIHAILYRYRKNPPLSDRMEHRLIDRFLAWEKRIKNGP